MGLRVCFSLGLERRENSYSTTAGFLAHVKQPPAKVLTIEVLSVVIKGYWQGFMRIKGYWQRFMRTVPDANLPTETTVWLGFS